MNNPKIDKDGNKCWYTEDGLLHREGGPAVESINNYRGWYINGALHRKNGPAIEYENGNKQWWYNGKHIECGSQEEFERLINLELFW